MRDGNGIMFISHRGDVMPSGFVPLSAGNVREHDPLAIYRESALFTRLRDTASFGGGAARAMSRASAEGRAVGRSRPLETRWPKIRSACTSRRPEMDGLPVYPRRERADLGDLFGAGRGFFFGR